jgi:ketosteroid isomerase-like protein
VERTSVEAWIAGYERAWRRPSVDRLAQLFTPDSSYLPSPWSQPVEGLEAIGRFWDAEREGPDELFTLHSEVLAVDGDVAIVRVEVDYTGGGDWRDLWVIRFGPDGRCTAFEEWPFAPDQPDGH